MTVNKTRIDKAVILGVLLVGGLLSYGLQSFIWQSNSKEARYEFESQTSNLTLFIIDDFQNLVDEFVVFSGGRQRAGGECSARATGLCAGKAVAGKLQATVFFPVFT